MIAIAKLIRHLHVNVVLLVLLVTGTVHAASPSINSINPATPTASKERQTVIVHGRNFDTRATVHLKDHRTGESFPNRTVYDRSSTKLELRIVFSDTPAEWSVEVVNPDGQKSGAYRFRVVAPPKPPAQARPRITSTDPAQLTGSTQRQPLVIRGENFDRKAKVTLRDLTNNQVFPDRSVSQRSDTSLTLSVNFTDQPAQWSAEVINPDGQTSGEYRFRVIAPPKPPALARPRITSINPTQPVGSTQRQPLVIGGENFDRKAKVTLRDLTNNQVFPDRSVSQRSDTSLTLSVNFTDQPAQWSVEVINSDGQTSGEYRFHVVAQPRPSITGIEPIQPTGSRQRQPFIIRGENFSPKATVTLRDLTQNQEFSNRRPSDRSATSLTLSVNFTDQPAQWSVEVINPDGQTSGEYRFRVEAPPRPRITAIEPSRPFASKQSQPLIIQGENFDQRAAVVLRNITRGHKAPSRSPSNRSNTSLTVSVNFTDQPAEWSVEVVNSDGQTSGEYRFQVPSMIGGEPPKAKATIDKVELLPSGQIRIFGSGFDDEGIIQLTNPDSRHEGIVFIEKNASIKLASHGPVEHPMRFQILRSRREYQLLVDFTHRAREWIIELRDREWNVLATHRFKLSSAVTGPEKPKSVENIEIIAELPYPLLGQKESNNYRDQEKYNKQFSGGTSACYATVFTMIHRGRPDGNPASMIDDHLNSVGEGIPNGAFDYQQPRDRDINRARIIQEINGAKRPVILVGTYRGIETKNGIPVRIPHVVLVVGVRGTDLIVLDPWHPQKRILTASPDGLKYAIDGDNPRGSEFEADTMRLILFPATSP